METIAASDKDFYPAFLDLMELGLIVLKQFSEDQEKSEYIEKNIDYRVMWYVWDEFLKKLFEGQSKIDKSDWIK
jgi:hypothetical protein